jgi:hypothetical protein
MPVARSTSQNSGRRPMRQGGWRGPPRRDVTDARVRKPQRPAAIDAHTPLPTRCPYHPDNALPRATMRATATCLAPGFVKRSLDEFKRLSLFGERRRAPSPPPRPQD